MIKNYFLIFLLLLLTGMQGKAQSLTPRNISRSTVNEHPADPPNTLFQFGVADAFINGIYNGDLTVGSLALHGNFGLGAPNLVDGELTLHNGKVYQTKASGLTIEAPDSLKTPFAFVSFFEPDTVFTINGNHTQKQVLDMLDGYLYNKNGMYAIRISGLFNHVRTRAFQPVIREPFPPLANMLDKQHFFEFKRQDGILIGYKLPAYLAGINIAGYHFHFLTSQFNAGGHALDFSSAQIKVEIAVITDFRLSAPTDRAFINYKFNNINKSDLEKVEKGN